MEIPKKEYSEEELAQIPPPCFRWESWGMMMKTWKA